MKYNPLVITKIKEFIEDQIVESNKVISKLTDPEQVKQAQEELKAVEIISAALSHFKMATLTDTVPVYNYGLENLTEHGALSLGTILDNFADGTLPLEMTQDIDKKTITMISTGEF